MKLYTKTANEFDLITRKIKAIAKDDVVVKEITERAKQTAQTTTMSLPQAMSFEADRYFNKQSNQTTNLLGGLNNESRYTNNTN